MEDPAGTCFWNDLLDLIEKNAVGMIDCSARPLRSGEKIAY